MANRDEIWEDNVRGKFYVDKECILCSLCSDLAPRNFKESPEGDHDIVYKQPETEEELKQCADALEQCPVEAIGSDGDVVDGAIAAPRDHETL
jgi:ferredoxin